MGQIYHCTAIFPIYETLYNLQHLQVMCFCFSPSPKTFSSTFPAASALSSLSPHPKLSSPPAPSLALAFIYKLRWEEGLQEITWVLTHSLFTAPHRRTGLTSNTISLRAICNTVSGSAKCTFLLNFLFSTTPQSPFHAAALYPHFAFPLNSSRHGLGVKLSGRELAGLCLTHARSVSQFVCLPVNLCGIDSHMCDWVPITGIWDWVLFACYFVILFILSLQLRLAFHSWPSCLHFRNWDHRCAYPTCKPACLVAFD